jgi:hypothetical protein
VRYRHHLPRRQVELEQRLVHLLIAAKEEEECFSDAVTSRTTLTRTRAKTNLSHQLVAVLVLVEEVDNVPLAHNAHQVVLRIDQRQPSAIDDVSA